MARHKLVLVDLLPLMDHLTSRGIRFPEGPPQTWWGETDRLLAVIRDLLASSEVMTESKE
jgi:hypothetical protein